MVEKEITMTVKVPEGIEATAHGHNVTLKGNGDEQSREFKSHRLNIEQKGDAIILIGSPVNKQTRALLMSVVAHIKNMIIGIKHGYKYEMKISYSHFPMTAEVKDNQVVINNFLGEKFPRKANIVGKTTVEVKGQDLAISGKELEEVSQTAANIELATKVRGKDIRRYTDGIYLTKKGTIDGNKEEFEVEIIRGRE
jgi:large subunit ribosomal protein L6